MAILWAETRRERSEWPTWEKEKHLGTHNMLNLEAAQPQQKETTLGSTSVSQKQEFEDTVTTGSMKLGSFFHLEKGLEKDLKLKPVFCSFSSSSSRYKILGVLNLESTASRRTLVDEQQCSVWGRCNNLHP